SARGNIFFDHAEEDIRDFHVTGVQTCALPISGTPRLEHAASQARLWLGPPCAGHAVSQARRVSSAPRLRHAAYRRCRVSSTPCRSEERRVGHARSALAAARVTATQAAALHVEV